MHVVTRLFMNQLMIPTVVSFVHLYDEVMLNSSLGEKWLIVALTELSGHFIPRPTSMFLMLWTILASMLAAYLYVSPLPPPAFRIDYHIFSVLSRRARWCLIGVVVRA